MTVDEERHDLSCHLQRSVRYHRLRERFFEAWSNTFSALSLLAGSSVVVALLAQSSAWVPLLAGAAVAGMQALDQVLRLGVKARQHNGLAGEFLSLERILAMRGDPTPDDLREMRAEVLSIEARERPIMRYLDLICHNQVARAIGSDDIEPLRWHQRRFAQYLSGDSALQR
ncbi:hypothetical protein SAMN05444414_11626 [Roseovarius marisflavi]|uniref:SMODS and SLOG-associating 2TM effector domain-containing protein n=1 Tax=Roseovarius marisflavi TaxID=1054996 RepID=A0A1M7B2P9_9RHOB|nr:hypothetical protein [Roseovarius marisflavi]SHL49243.1 hypothetical protein SAMN05444414_11626 [Roseovarius marisflavi]